MPGTFDRTLPESLLKLTDGETCDILEFRSDVSAPGFEFLPRSYVRISLVPGARILADITTVNPSVKFGGEGRFDLTPVFDGQV